MARTREEWLTVWELETGNLEQKVKTVASLMREEAKAEKDLAMVRDRLAGQTDKVKSKTDKLLKSFVDYKAVIDTVVVGLRKLADVTDRVMMSGTKMARLRRANTLDISAAKVATKGLVDEMTLLAAANTAVEFKLGLTSQQFAKFSEFSVIQAQKLGKNASELLDNLFEGTAKGSAEILNNLGLLVRKGASVVEITEAINVMMGRGTVEVKNAGDSYEQLKVRLTDAENALSEWITTSDGNTMVFKQATYNIDIMSQTWKMLKGNIGGATDAVILFSSWSDKMGFGDLGGAMRQMWAIQKGQQIKIDAGRKAGLAGAQTSLDAANKALADMHGKALALHKVWDPGRHVTGLMRKRATSTTAGPQIGPYGLGGWRGELDPFGAGWETAQAHHGMKRIEEQGKYEKALGREKPYKLGEDPAIKKWKAHTKAAEAKRQEREETERQTAANKDLYATYSEINGVLGTVTSAMASYAGSIWMAADAAIQGGKSFGSAMASIFKQTMLQLATESTVKGFLALAKYAFSMFLDKSALVAAGLYFTTATLAGGVGLGMSSGGVGSRPSASAGRSGGGYQSSTYRSTPKQRQQSDAKYEVAIYVGDQKDPTLAKYLTKQITHQVRQQF